MDIYAEARDAGIATEYFDALGQHQHVSHDVLERVLRSLPPGRDGASGPIIHRIGSGSPSVRCMASDGDPWVLFNGVYPVSNGTIVEGCAHLPDDLLPGVYALQVSSEIAESTPQQILVVPQTAFQGEFDRGWVLAVQLYSVRSERNWAIGDFADLRSLLSLAAEIGCAGIGLNPLHALFDDQPENPSPYAPSSRLFLNPIYIDVTAAPGYESLDDQMRQAIAMEKQRDLIDYGAVWTWKLDALRKSFAYFKTHPRSADTISFDKYRQQGGALLDRFTYFEVVRKTFKEPWWEWPKDYQKVGDHLTKEQENDREFVAYLQWVAHTQLQACSDFAASKGLKIGLYLDVAVGVRADGFDAWLEQTSIARGLSVGAPPDLLNTAGQDWGLAGFNGPGLTRSAFEPFRTMLEASARYAGAIRLDHIMGLARLYLVPAGFSPREGAYLTMPLEPLLAVTAMESQAQRCIIIGEDLGTVPEGFRERLQDWGVWSYQVMMFEREHDGRFKQPDLFKPNALVTFNTHDLPSYAGWRNFHDLGVKRAIQIDPGENNEERESAISALDRVLSDQGLSPADFASVVEFLARTPSRILSVGLDDIVGAIEQINIPGTVDAHPNWRRRLPVPIEDIYRSTALQNLTKALAGRKQP